MSDTFVNLVSKALSKDVREGSQLATISSELKQKALALSGTMRLRADEYLSDEDIDSAEKAASDALDRAVEDLAEKAIEKLLNAAVTKKASGKLKLKSPGLLRLKNGTIISPLNLALLLNSTLYKYTIALMGVGGRLNNRTGRLAHSGKVTNISQTGNSKVSFWFTYQLAPYSTFEPGGKQGSPERSPKELFSQALRDALKDLLSPKGSVLEKNRIMRMVKR